ncbi:hypothetical protein TKK_0016702 [Trichogramma kaykai]
MERGAVWAKEMAGKTKQKFMMVFKKYCDMYANEDSADEPAFKKRRTSDNDEMDFNALYVKPEQTDVWMSEVQKYLDSSRPDEKADILLWWKLHCVEYHIVARMARDILCIPATSVPAERLFSEASLVLTKNRCSLDNESLRELICINRWTKSSKREEICEL